MARLMCLFFSMTQQYMLRYSNGIKISTTRYELKNRVFRNLVAQLVSEFNENYCKSNDQYFFSTDIFFVVFPHSFIPMKNEIEKRKSERKSVETIDAKRKLFLWCLRFEQFTPFSCLFPASEESACMQSIAFACSFRFYSSFGSVLGCWSNIRT